MGRVAKWLVIGFFALAVLLAIAITLTVGWRPFV